MIGIRKRVWEQGTNVDARDLAEALRDADNSLRSIPTFTLITTDAQWTLPFTLTSSARPRGVLVIRVETPDNPLAGVAAFPSPMWQWKDGSIRIFRADGFVIGTRYVIEWKLIS